MSDEIDIMSVDLSSGGGKSERNIRPKIESEENTEDSDIIQALPKRSFRVHYYINNQEPISLEKIIDVQVNGILSREQAHRELLKEPDTPDFIKKNPVMLKINHIQEVIKDNLINPNNFLH